MILGMTPLTFIHVVISLIAIVAGFPVLLGMLKSERRDGWNLIFLVLTLATSLTGFLFPFAGFTPAIGVGILSTVILAIAFAARYAFGMQGIWRPVYVATALAAFYFNVFVLVVQAFLKVPALNALAPNGSEPPFAIAQGIALLLFIGAGLLSLRRFHPI